MVKNFGKKSYIALIFLVLIAVLAIFSKWLVVAWVDNRPITKIEILSELEKRYSSDLKEQLITERLIYSQAQRRGINVTPEEIADEYHKVAQQFGGEDGLKSLLTQQALSEEDFKKQIYLQLLVRKTFGNDITVSDDEINKFLEQQPQATNSAQASAMRQDASEQLKQQKISQNFVTWLNEAKSSDRVKRF